MTAEFDDIQALERALAEANSTDPRVLTARRLEAAGAKVPPVRDAVLAAARAQAAAEPTHHWGQRVMVAAVVVGLASGGVAAAAAASLPGDPLWNIRRVGQVLRVAVTSGDEAKTDLLLAQASGAIAAAEAFEARGDLDAAERALREALQRIADARAHALEHQAAAARVDEVERRSDERRRAIDERRHGRPPIDDDDDDRSGPDSDHVGDRDDDHGNTPEPRGSRSPRPQPSIDDDRSGQGGRGGRGSTAPSTDERTPTPRASATDGPDEDGPDEDGSGSDPRGDRSGPGDDLSGDDPA